MGPLSRPDEELGKDSEVPPGYRTAENVPRDHPVASGTTEYSFTPRSLEGPSGWTWSDLSRSRNTTTSTPVSLSCAASGYRDPPGFPRSYMS